MQSCLLRLKLLVSTWENWSGTRTTGLEMLLLVCGMWFAHACGCVKACSTHWNAWCVCACTCVVGPEAFRVAYKLETANKGGK